MSKKKIIQAIQTATGEKCGNVSYDPSARDWKITGVFESDTRIICDELSKIGLTRKQSSSGFYVEISR